MVEDMPHFGEPQLRIVIEPQSIIRFRYESESENESHGVLKGNQGKESYPTVELENYSGIKRVIIQVSLYTEDKEEQNLAFKFKGKNSEENVLHMEKYLKEDNTAEFGNLKILCKRQKEIEKLLMDKKPENVKRKDGEVQNDKEVKEKARTISKSVRLYFEAFEEDNRGTPLCSLFSDIVNNDKMGASQGDLKIHDMSKNVGCWRGGEKVILLCNKIPKNNVKYVKIRFFEVDDCDNKVWSEYAEQAGVHNQDAIIFNTPPYKENVEKTVFVCIECQHKVSEAWKFTYTSEEVPSKKRKYMTKQSISRSSSDTSSASPMDISSDFSSFVHTPVYLDIKSGLESACILSPSPSSPEFMDVHPEDYSECKEINLSLKNSENSDSLFADKQFQAITTPLNSEVPSKKRTCVSKKSVPGSSSDLSSMSNSSNLCSNVPSPGSSGFASGTSSPSIEALSPSRIFEELPEDYPELMEIQVIIKVESGQSLEEIYPDVDPPEMFAPADCQNSIGNHSGDACISTAFCQEILLR